MIIPTSLHRARPERSLHPDGGSFRFFRPDFIDHFLVRPVLDNLKLQNSSMTHCSSISNATPSRCAHASASRDGSNE